jgi:hypothetical protein
VANFSDLERGSRNVIIGTCALCVLVGFVGGYAASWKRSGDVAVNAEDKVRHEVERVAYFEGELGRMKDLVAAVRVEAEVDAHLASAMESTLRGALEARAGNWGTADDHLRRAMASVREAQKLVEGEARSDLESVLRGYEPASMALVEHEADAADAIIDVVALLDAGRTAARAARTAP